MRIGIDASRAGFGVRTGTENYSIQLLRSMMEAMSAGAGDDALTLYTGHRLPPELLGGAARVRHMPFPRLWTHVRLSLEMLLQRPDVLFVPAHVIPLVHPRASVATIHDVGHLYYPEVYPPATLRYLEWSTRHNVKSAAHLIADSDSTKRDLVDRYGVDPYDVTVVYPGIMPGYFEVAEEGELTGVRQRYQLEGPYVLYVGTLQPRKNVERLIEAFNLAKQRHQFPERLVLAGRMGWLPEGILKRLQAAGQNVTLAGYVPDTDLRGLYAGATAVALPSLFEGFGMPLAEAMAVGTLAIGSTSSSLPEVVGDAGLLVDPLNTEELAEAIAWACTHPEARKALAAHGRERARRFRWDQAATTVLGVLRRVARERSGLAMRW